jgi:uncharacterized SAM-binding protein YcdF (DUF218 family)
LVVNNINIIKMYIKRPLWFVSALPFILAILNSCAYSSKASRQLLKESLNKKYDMIVVPGVPFEDGKWSATMKDRVFWSKYLYDKGIARNVMYSGSAVYSPYYEAEIMALYGEKLGIPKENIYTEIKAKHSTENIYYSYRKSKKLGFSTIALASDPFQTKMLRRFTRKIVSKDVALIPIVYDTIQQMEATIPDPVIDYKSAYADTFKSIMKKEGFLKRMRGTRGKDIDTTAY